MLIAWMTATTLSALISAQIARKAGADGVLFALMAVLLGPGAIPLTRAASGQPAQPKLGPILAVIGLVGGFGTTMFILAHGSLGKYVELFDGMSLVLPTSTQFVCLFTKGVGSWAGTIAFFAFNWNLPALG